MPPTPNSVLARLQTKLEAQAGPRATALLEWIRENPDKALAHASGALQKRRTPPSPSAEEERALDRLDEEHAIVYDLFLYDPGDALLAGRAFEFSPARLLTLFSEGHKRQLGPILRQERGRPQWFDETQAQLLERALVVCGVLAVASPPGARARTYRWVAHNQPQIDAYEKQALDWEKRGHEIEVKRPRIAEEDEIWMRSIVASLAASTDFDLLTTVAATSGRSPRPPFSATATRRLEQLRGFTRWIRKEDLARADKTPKNIGLGTSVRVLKGPQKGLIGVTVESGSTNPTKAKQATNTTQAWRVEFPPSVES